MMKIKGLTKRKSWLKWLIIRNKMENNKSDLDVLTCLDHPTHYNQESYNTNLDGCLHQLISGVTHSF